MTQRADTECTAIEFFPVSTSHPFHRALNKFRPRRSSGCRGRRKEAQQGMRNKAPAWKGGAGSGGTPSEPRRDGKLFAATRSRATRASRRPLPCQIKALAAEWTHVALGAVEAEGIDLVRGPQDDGGQGQRAANGQPQLDGERLHGIGGRPAKDGRISRQAVSWPHQRRLLRSHVSAHAAQML